MIHPMHCRPYAVGEGVCARGFTLKGVETLQTINAQRSCPFGVYSVLVDGLVIQVRPCTETTS